FFGTCGMKLSEGLQSFGEGATLNPDAEPSRKERGHRGVRPRHLNRRAFGSVGEGSSSGPGPRRFLFSAPVCKGGLCGATLGKQYILGDDRLRRGRLVRVVASRGPGRPRKTPGKNISADSHEYALAA